MAFIREKKKPARLFLLPRGVLGNFGDQRLHHNDAGVGERREEFDGNAIADVTKTQGREIIHHIFFGLVEHVIGRAQHSVSNVAKPGLRPDDFVTFDLNFTDIKFLTPRNPIRSVELGPRLLEPLLAGRTFVEEIRVDSCSENLKLPHSAINCIIMHYIIYQLNCNLALG